MCTLLLSFPLLWKNLASQTLLTQGDQRNQQKKNLYNSLLYLSSTWNERKVNIPNWHHQLEEIRVHPSVRTLANACSKRSANSAWHHPIHQNIAGRKDFHPVYSGNKKKLNQPAPCCMWSFFCYKTCLIW